MITTPKSINFSHDSTEYILFKEPYYSGCEVSIYFGDIWVDQLVSLSFTMQENSNPIYGYASYTFDSLARGNRIVQGTFKIAFKENYYLKSVYENLSTSGINSSAASDSGVSTENSNMLANIIKASNNFSSVEFEALANAYEKTFWGNDTQINHNTYKPYFTYDREPGDINVGGFNIIISYGPLSQNSTLENASIATILGVYINGVNQEIAPTGQPIFETYSFIARDINGDVSKIGK